MSSTEKYAAAAERWSEEQYADSVAYLRHRAELIVSLGPRLEPGDRVLDLACGDAGLADFLRLYEYTGVDASDEMVRAARASRRPSGSSAATAATSRPGRASAARRPRSAAATP